MAQSDPACRIAVTFIKKFEFKTCLPGVSTDPVTSNFSAFILKIVLPSRRSPTDVVLLTFNRQNAYVNWLLYLLDLLCWILIFFEESFLKQHLNDAVLGCGN